MRAENVILFFISADKTDELASLLPCLAYGLVVCGGGGGGIHYS